jgi:hypothetical protein
MDKKIKSITALRFDYMKGETQEEEVQLDGFKTALEEFDEKGNLLKETTYDDNEEIEQVYVYKYNEKGYLIEEILYYDAEIELVSRKEYVLHDNGLKHKEIVHYSEEEYDTIEYRYNDKNQLTEKVQFNNSGEVETTEKFIYGGINLIENVVYDAQDKPLSQKYYTYDEKGNEIEFQSNDLVEDIKFSKEYSYDEKGRRIESLTYNDKNQLREKLLYDYGNESKPLQIIEETPFKKNTVKLTYDEKGNTVCQEEYNRQEVLINKITRTFGEGDLLLESDIIINNVKDDIGIHYMIKNEYEFH